MGSNPTSEEALRPRLNLPPLPHSAGTGEDALPHKALGWLPRAVTSNHPDPGLGAPSARGPGRQGWDPLQPCLPLPMAHISSVSRAERWVLSCPSPGEQGPRSSC